MIECISRTIKVIDYKNARWKPEINTPTCFDTTISSSGSTRHGHRQLPEVVLTQFVSPDDEHDVLETCRELKMKINT